MRTVIVCLMCLLLAGCGHPAFDKKEAIVVYGEDQIVGHLGIVPFEGQRLSLGVCGTGVFDETDAVGMHIEDYLAGVYVEYPFIDGVTVDPIPSLDGEAFAGVEVQTLWAQDGQGALSGDFYATPYIGAELKISQNVAGRMSYRYNTVSDVVREHVIAGGVAIRWGQSKTNLAAIRRREAEIRAKHE